MHSPTPCYCGSIQPAADASSRCVTPTWADLDRISPWSAGRWGAPAASSNSSHRALGNTTAPLAAVLLLQSSRELSPTPHARIKEPTENGAEVEPGVASSSALDVPSAATPADYVPGLREPHPSELNLSFPGLWSPVSHPSPPSGTGVKRRKEVKYILRPGIVGGCGKYTIENFG